MIDYSDLVGLPHRTGAHHPATGALDCAGVVMEILVRLGRPHAAESFSAALRPSDGDESGWTQVDPHGAREPGDVLVYSVGDKDLHVSIAVAPFRAVSSARRLGFYAYAIAANAPSLLGVWRPPAEPTP